MKEIVNNKEAERIIIVMIVGGKRRGGLVKKKIQRPRNVMHRRDIYPLCISYTEAQQQETQTLALPPMKI